MKALIEWVEEKKQEEVRIRLLKGDASAEALREYVELENWRIVSLPGRKDGELCRIKSSDILYIDSVNEVQYLHTQNGVYETRERLYQLERMLPVTFLRISRAVIYNRERAVGYRPLLNGMMEVLMENGESVYISRRYLRDVRDKLLEG